MLLGRRSLQGLQWSEVLQSLQGLSLLLVWLWWMLMRRLMSGHWNLCRIGCLHSRGSACLSWHGHCHRRCQRYSRFQDLSEGRSQGAAQMHQSSDSQGWCLQSWQAFCGWWMWLLLSIVSPCLLVGPSTWSQLQCLQPARDACGRCQYLSEGAFERMIMKE